MLNRLKDKIEQICNLPREVSYLIFRCMAWLKIKLNLSNETEEETKGLIKSWAYLDKNTAKTYLTGKFQDPRINLQSILTRHFLIKELFGDEFADVMRDEMTFSIDANYKIFRDEHISDQELDRYKMIWPEKLAEKKHDVISVLEPACGSANDYRYFSAYGIARFLDYRGFDLNETNIKNAREMLPQANFYIDNILEMKATGGTFDYVIIFDLFEHLSLSGLDKVLNGICGMANKGMAINFFNMSDIAAHKERPLRYYHLNALSMPMIRRFFTDQGFSSKIIRIYDLLPLNFVYMGTENKKAYTFLINKNA